VAATPAPPEEGVKVTAGFVEPLCANPLPEMVTMVPTVPVAGFSEVSVGPGLLLLWQAASKAMDSTATMWRMEPPFRL
jgi:hypothetical protein